MLLSKGPGFALPDVLGGELKLAKRTHALILVLCPLFPLPSPSPPLLLLSDVQRRPTASHQLGRDPPRIQRCHLVQPLHRPRLRSVPLLFLHTRLIVTLGV